LLLSIALNFACGFAIDAAQQRGERGRSAVALGVLINLAVLGYFKYFNFFIATLADLMRWLDLPQPKAESVSLPLGISFFTFHALSYLVDVYRRKTRAERSPVALAMYIMMFPQLVAGPIIRFASVARQIHKRHLTVGRVQLGIHIFITGLAQKVLIANTVALPADQIFNLAPSALTMTVAWLGTLCYTLQIYFDFAGYSNMAIGLGLMTGFAFPRNFDYPYVSQSITDFWRRWHITLSRWFRDYLYIPLGGNRTSPFRNYLNLFVVFFLCGLWHGASWTFALWGIYHGAFLVIERAGFGACLQRVPRPARHVYTLLVVMVGWVFFRSNDMGSALAVLRAMTGGAEGDTVATPLRYYLTNTVCAAVVVGGLASVRAGGTLCNLPACALSTGKVRRTGVNSSTLQSLFQSGTSLVLLGLSAVSVASGTYNPFIYFRF